MGTIFEEGKTKKNLTFEENASKYLLNVSRHCNDKTEEVNKQ